MRGLVGAGREVQQIQARVAAAHRGQQQRVATAVDVAQASAVLDRSTQQEDAPVAAMGHDHPEAIALHAQIVGRREEHSRRKFEMPGRCLDQGGSAVHEAEMRTRAVQVDSLPVPGTQTRLARGELQREIAHRSMNRDFLRVQSTPPVSWNTRRSQASSVMRSQSLTPRLGCNALCLWARSRSRARRSNSSHGVRPSSIRSRAD